VLSVTGTVIDSDGCNWVLYTLSVWGLLVVVCSFVFYDGWAGASRIGQMVLWQLALGWGLGFCVFL